MDKKDLPSLIKEYLKNAQLMQVATVRENQPWACSVYFAFDNDLHLYWISKPSRRHSEEIRSNKKVAGTIVLPHTPGDDVRGLQFQGIAKELTNPKEMKEAMECYAKRYGMSEKRVQAILDKSDGHLPYKIIPFLYVLFDEVNFPNNPRQEYRV